MKSKDDIEGIVEELATDVVALPQEDRNTSSSQFLSDKESEENKIVEAVRNQILAKQREILCNYLIKNNRNKKEEIEAASASTRSFREYSKNEDNKEQINQVLQNSACKAELEKVEIQGYSKILEEFKNDLTPIQWNASTSEVGNNITTKLQSLKNPENNQEIAVLTETTHNLSPPTKIRDSQNKEIELRKCRTIDFPNKLAQGPCDLFFALKDQDGTNIPKKNAAGLSLHYNKAGLLIEFTCPSGVIFTSNEPDSFGYIEHQGKIYTLPVTKARYDQMMIIVERNQEHELNISPSLEQKQNSGLGNHELQKENRRLQPELGALDPEMVLANKTIEQKAQEIREKDKLLEAKNSELSSTKAELNKFMAHINEQNRIIAELKAQLDLEKSKNKGRREGLEEKARNLDSRSADLDAKATALEQKEREQNQKNVDQATKATQLAEKDQKQKQKDLDQATKDTQLPEKEREQNQRDVDQEKRNAELAEKDQEQKQKDLDQATKAAALDEKARNLDSGITSLATKATALEQKEREQKQKDLYQKTKDTQLAEKDQEQNQISDDQRRILLQLAEQERSLASRSAALDINEMVLKDKDKMLQQKDLDQATKAAALTEKEREQNQRDVDQEKRDAELAEKERNLVSRSAALDTKEMALNDRDQMLQQKDLDQATKAAALAEKEREQKQIADNLGGNDKKVRKGSGEYERDDQSKYQKLLNAFVDGCFRFAHIKKRKGKDTFDDMDMTDIVKIFGGLSMAQKEVIIKNIDKLEIQGNHFSESNKAVFLEEARRLGFGGVDGMRAAKDKIDPKELRRAMQADWKKPVYEKTADTLRAALTSAGSPAHQPFRRNKNGPARGA